MPDAVFDDPQLAEVYDPLDPDRSDLEMYADITAEVGARVVLDVGCGTGTFALMLAGRGLTVTGVDPARASLDVARRKVGADRVRWINTDATALPDMQVDLATMTANVAQVFLTVADLENTLRGIHAALRPAGWVVLETRDPAAQAWLGWNRAATQLRTDVPGQGIIRRWQEVTHTRLPLVTFGSTTVCERVGTVITSDSTLRFHTRAEVEDALARTGFDLRDVRDAPDRPGREFVFLAQRGDSSARMGRGQG